MNANNQNTRYREETLYSEVSPDPTVIINTTLPQQCASYYLKLPSDFSMNTYKDSMVSQESEIVEFEFDRKALDDSVNIASFRRFEDEDDAGKEIGAIEMEDHSISFRWCCSLMEDPDFNESCRII